MLFSQTAEPVCVPAMPVSTTEQPAILGHSRQEHMSWLLNIAIEKFITVQSRFSDIKVSDNLCDVLTIFKRPFFNLLHKQYN